LGYHQLSVSTHGQRNMIINQVASALMLFLCFDFMIRTNKKSERLLHAYAIDAGEKKENLEKINGELDRFVYSASHDLRSPLLSIQGLVRIALAEPDSSNDKKYFELIGDRVTKLDEFIKEIIEYSRNSRTEVNHELVNLKELIGDVVAHLQYLEGTDKIEVYISCIDEPLLLDKGRTRIILSNILGNAIKYHNLRQDDPWVEVKTELKEDFCVLTITDNGTGIPADKQDRIFDMFFRATDRSAGSGLGLFIVKETVMKLNGKIGVKSEYGRGSEFVITLPLHK
jgi:signal transduction histidine kinase